MIDIIGAVFLAIVLLIVLLMTVITIYFVVHEALVACPDNNKFSRRHNIELIETEHTKFATCIKCGRRWVTDEVDEMLFIKRESKKYHNRNDI